MIKRKVLVCENIWYHCNMNTGWNNITNEGEGEKLFIILTGKGRKDGFISN